MRPIRILILGIVIHALLPAALRAADFDYMNDSVHKRLYGEFLEYYVNGDKEKEFYKNIEELSQYYRKHGLILQYYKMQLNNCLYDTEHNRPMEALKRANSMLKEMQAEGFDAYSQVYMALGTIFESRGNIRMARYYFEEGINTLGSDNGSKMGIYSRLAYLQIFRNPAEAKYWNDKYFQEATTFPPYMQVYLYIDAMIKFVVGNKHDFMKAYSAYHNYHNSQTGLDNYGKEVLEIARLAFDGDYDEALYRLTTHAAGDLNTVGCYDMRILIYKMMGQPEKALEVSSQRAECIDSLNSDMLFANLNDLNAQAGVARTKTKAAKDHERMLLIVLSLAGVIILMLFIGILHYRQNRKSLKHKNEQLRTALAMAEEGEKMKTEFVRSVSHEIRTPLNAITGFNDILNNTQIELSAEERSDLLQRINTNVQAITNIVDEMLHVADKESNEFYPKSKKILCNQFLPSVLYEYRDKVSSNIELKYTTNVLNRFQIETNEDGLRKVLEQLIENAIKFTKEGSIELHCEQSADNQRVLISVTDTGKGISKEEQEKIFESFYKSDSFEQGIGLGLTVSRKIARKLGGNLLLDTTYEGGARFVLALPVG